MSVWKEVDFSKVKREVRKSKRTLEAMLSIGHLLSKIGIPRRLPDKEALYDKGLLRSLQQWCAGSIEEEDQGADQKPEGKKTRRKLLQWSREKKWESELSRKWLGGGELQFMKHFGNRIHTPTTDVVLNLSGMKDSVSVNQDGLTKRAGCKSISLWQVNEGRTQPFSSFLCIPTLPPSIKSEFQATVSTSWGSIREEACGLTYLALGTACP